MMEFNTDKIKELADQVKNNMDQLVNMTDQIFKNLPKDQMHKISPIQQDIHGILDAVKNGDSLKIHEIQKKYACHSTK